MSHVRAMNLLNRVTADMPASGRPAARPGEEADRFAAALADLRRPRDAETSPVRGADPAGHRPDRGQRDPSRVERRDADAGDERAEAHADRTDAPRTPARPEPSDQTDPTNQTAATASEKAPNEDRPTDSDAPAGEPQRADRGDAKTAEAPAPPRDAEAAAAPGKSADAAAARPTDALLLQQLGLLGRRPKTTPGQTTPSAPANQPGGSSGPAMSSRPDGHATTAPAYPRAQLEPSGVPTSTATPATVEVGVSRPPGFSSDPQQPSAQPGGEELSRRSQGRGELAEVRAKANAAAAQAAADRDTAAPMPADRPTEAPRSVEAPLSESPRGADDLAARLATMLSRGLPAAGGERSGAEPVQGATGGPSNSALSPAAPEPVRADARPAHSAPSPAPQTAPTWVARHADATEVERIARVIRSNVSDRNGQIQMRLHPPELGTMRVDVRLRAGQLDLRVQVERAGVQELMTSRLGRLGQALEQHGVVIQRAEVEIRSPASSGASDDGQPREQAFGGGAQRGGAGGGEPQFGGSSPSRDEAWTSTDVEPPAWSEDEELPVEPVVSGEPIDIRV